MIYGLEDYLTISLLGIGIIITIWAQIKINSNYNKYKKIKLTKTISGQEIARAILDSNNLSDIHILETKGNLTDHYDPSRKVIKLSSDIFNGETIAAAAVAAHEVGHAIQDKDGYTFMKVRSILVPFINLISYLGYFGIIVSIFAGITGYLTISLIILLATLLFQLVTLPVEFDASKRAKEQLLKLNLITNEEHAGANHMLGAAALTYVASLLTTLINIARILIMINNRRD